MMESSQAIASTVSSTGCQTCRSRRIKCDRAFPVCQKCAKSRRLCVKTLPADGDLSIHIENSYASGTSKRPRGPRSRIAPALQIDLHTRAWVYYLNHHLQQPSGQQLIMHGVSDSVRKWAEVTKYSLVTSAISSLALATFSRIQHYPKGAAQAREKHVEVLRAAQIVIPDLVNSDVDAALLAVFLMSRFEDSVHDPESVLSSFAFNSYSHHDGAAAILKIWHGRSGSRVQPATDIIKHTRRGLIRSAFLRHQAVPPWLTDGALFGEYGLELEYDRVLVGIAGLRQRLQELRRQAHDQEALSPDLLSWAQELSIEAYELDAGLQSWTTRVPGSMCPRRHLLPAQDSPPGQHFYSSVVFSYSSIAHATIWMHYYSTRMLLIRARLRILETIQPTSDDLATRQRLDEEQCCMEMQAMATALSSSVPFTLKRFAVVDPWDSQNGSAVNLTLDEEVSPYLASVTAWPLSVAAGIIGLDIEQKSWFQSELAFLGKVSGFGVFQHICDHKWFDL